MPNLVRAALLSFFLNQVNRDRCNMMKVIVSLCAILTFAHGSVITGPPLVRTDSAIVKSDQVGGSFAYSTLQTNTYSPVAAPVFLQYSVARPLYQPIYNPSFVTSPIYGGLFGHPSVISQAPIVQNPIFGFPGLIPGQGPVQSPVPVQPPSQGIAPGDIPAGGEALDDDTVSVEAAY